MFLACVLQMKQRLWQETFANECTLTHVPVVTIHVSSLTKVLINGNTQDVDKQFGQLFTVPLVRYAASSKVLCNS